MGAMNKEQIIRLCNEINKKEGQGAVYTIGSKNANLKIDRWSTGIEDLDAIIGGGMPEGRVVEIFGPESSGKTTLLKRIAQNISKNYPDIKLIVLLIDERPEEVTDMKVLLMPIGQRYLVIVQNNFWCIDLVLVRQH